MGSSDIRQSGDIEGVLVDFSRGGMALRGSAHKGEPKEPPQFQLLAALKLDSGTT